MSQALYRKYRSRNLDEVLGQDHITSLLKSALKKGRVAHAYLLTGPKGTGKTSVARILAHQMNQLPYEDDKTHLDIIEIDAASNNGVDNIRDLREKAQVAPVAAKYKVYIVDEVHMLSKAAFNALLKTLEEPPEHIVFILATTDADKLPPTILSRVQQYYFRPISKQVISQHLKSIANSEGFKIDDAAADLIAEHAKGGFRDSLSLLDQLSTLSSKKNPLTKDQVAASLGLSSQEKISELLQAHINQDAKATVKIIQEIEELGGDALIITKQLLSLAREQLLDNPQLVRLISELIEVTRHPHPDLKLLTVLMNYPNQATTLQSVPKPQVKLTSTEVKPATTAVVASAPKIAMSVKEPEASYKKPAEAAKPFTGDFNWQSMLDESKNQSMGLYGLIAKCSHEFQDGRLIIYAGNSFTQKKLDDAKNRPLLSQVLQKSQGADIEVEITNDQKPPTDPKLAAVAAVMGGGQEVKYEEIA